MPTIRVDRNFFLTVPGDYQPGDQPPAGYNDWHEWARVQDKAGLRQKTCARCSLWKFPQELSDVIDEAAAFNKRGRQVGIIKSPVCNGCLNAEAKDETAGQGEGL